MSKVNCDICGTVYPDNANACPICGYPRKGSESDAEETSSAVSVTTAAAGSASRVKGGRFSNKNVKKRNQNAAPGNRSRKQEPEKKNNTGLIVLVAILLIAVLLVGGYIIWRFLDGRDAYNNPSKPSGGDSQPSASETAGSQPQQTDPTETGVACIAMTISDPTVTLKGPGRGWKLSVTLTPEDTTDVLTFVSSDENVVVVSQDGRLTAVGAGTAVITVTCGQVSRECTVYCNFEEETQPTEPTKPTEPSEPTEPTEPVGEGLVINKDDATLFYEGETFTLKATFNGEAVSPAVITWVSSDESVATVSSTGKVTAVGRGKATISVTYNGQTQKCIVRCNFPEETEPTEPEYTDTNWKISHTDVTLGQGESFTLKLTNDAGETASVTWTVSKTGIVSIDGNKITGSASGTVTVTATIDGTTYSCIVRVK